MKRLRRVCLVLIILTSVFELTAQNIRVLKPTLLNSNTYTAAQQQKWSKFLANNQVATTAEEEKMLELLEELKGPNIGTGRCSWYCGGGAPYKITASSVLAPQGKFNYKADNIHDFDLFTAWVPSDKQNPVGEKINFYFKSSEPVPAPRINKILIWNGCIYNTDLWTQNARVAKFKLYIDGKPTAILQLQDVDNTQEFSITPVRSAGKKDLVMTLEIMEVYPGTKYKDVVVSEINFDGLDVHCFAAGTKITMADYSTKNIEQIKKNDTVLTFDGTTQKLVSGKVEKLVTARHSHLQKLVFSDREIIVTNDHPFWTAENKWASVNPDKSNRNYTQNSEVVKLNAGDLIYAPVKKEYAVLLDIVPIDGEQLSYTIDVAEGNFIANGLLVKTENIK